MSTATKNSKSIATSAKVGTCVGKMVSYNNSLKLFHWHVTGKASYAQHMALDQALETLLDATDRLVETTYALIGDIEIVVPETKTPSNIVNHAQEYFDYVADQRKLFPEDFTQSILDDFQESLQQLLYRLKRLQ